MADPGSYSTRVGSADAQRSTVPHFDHGRVDQPAAQRNDLLSDGGEPGSTTTARQHERPADFLHHTPSRRQVIEKLSEMLEESL